MGFSLSSSSSSRRRRVIGFCCGAGVEDWLLFKNGERLRRKVTEIWRGKKKGFRALCSGLRGLGLIEKKLLLLVLKIKKTQKWEIERSGLCGLGWVGGIVVLENLGNNEWICGVVLFYGISKWTYNFYYSLIMMSGNENRKEVDRKKVEKLGKGMNKFWGLKNVRRLADKDGMEMGWVASSFLCLSLSAVRQR